MISRRTEPIRSHPRDIIGAIAGWLAGQIVKVHEPGRQHLRCFVLFAQSAPLDSALSKGKSSMKSGPKSAEEYRATGLLCRQQAACDPDKGWQLLGEAERWEYLADQQSASDLKGCNFPLANVEGNKVWL